MRHIPTVVVLLLLVLALIVLPQIISTNTVRHEDCLTGYRVADC